MVTQSAWFRDLKFQIWWGLNIKFVENYFSFSKLYVTSEGAVSHDVLYHQLLPITRNRERFDDNSYFE